MTINDDANAAVATVADGVATFAGVTLAPDTASIPFSITATCLATDGSSVQSGSVSYFVDTGAPALTVLEPAPGQHFSFESGDDVNSERDELQFNVCGNTDNPDALNLSPDLGEAAANFCVRRGVESPVCAPAVTEGAGSADGACVEYTCPSNAPFTLTVSLTDAAGNVDSQEIVEVTCSSDKLDVVIISPADEDQLIAAGQMMPPAGTLDADANEPGGQLEVIACSSAAVGSTATLFGSVLGNDPAELDQVELVAATDDVCGVASPLGSVAHFLGNGAGVTLPESTINSNGTTIDVRLFVKVTDESTETGQSGDHDVWVDTKLPIVTWVNPFPSAGAQYPQEGLCGLFRSPTELGINLQFTCEDHYPVSIEIDGPSTNQPDDLPGGGLVGGTEPKIFNFDFGASTLTAEVTDPAGNGGLMAPCIVDVGEPPTITWDAPLAGTTALVGADTAGASDDDDQTAGWQGDLIVTVTDFDFDAEPTAQVAFSLDGSQLPGSPVSVTEGNPVATLSSVTIPDALSAVIVATVVSSALGTGTSVLNVVVDTLAPGEVADLSATELKRRDASFTLSWTPATDNGGGAVDYYDVRVADSADTGVIFAEENFETNGAAVVFSGSTSATSMVMPGQTMEADQYFAVRAVDAVGNVGPVAFTAAVATHFYVTVLESPASLLQSPVANERFGAAIDGTADLDGDGLSDLVVGSRKGGVVYIYWGSASGYSATADVTITGAANMDFGSAVAVVGDVDGDDALDIAIGAFGAGAVHLYGGYKTRADWTNKAIPLISTITPGTGGFYLEFGANITPLGDFDGDTYPDFAIGVPLTLTTGFTGSVVIVRGSATALPAIMSIENNLGKLAGDRIRQIMAPPSTCGFGYILGTGPYYGTPAGSIVVGAPGSDPTPGNAHSYAPGNGDDDGLFLADAVEHSVVEEPGFGFALTGVGVFDGHMAIGVSSPTVSKAYAYFGSETGGMFTNRVVFENTGGDRSDDRFGEVVIGGALWGQGAGTQVSFIGADSTPDLVLAGDFELGVVPTVYIVDGSAAQTAGQMGSPVDVKTIATVALDLGDDSGFTNVDQVTMPWVGSALHNSVIGDLNGDGVGDFAIGENVGGENVDYDGRAVVIW